MLGKKEWKNRNKWSKLDLIPTCVSVFLQVKASVLFLA